MDYKSLSDSLKASVAGFETPFFLYDLDAVSRNYQLLEKVLHPDRIFYAVKCCGLAPVLRELQENGCGFEANNLAELEKAFAAGASPERITNSSPLTPARDVAGMYAQGVRHFAFDSRSQLDNLGHNAPGANVYLRIYTTNRGSQFELSRRLGAISEDVPALMDYAVKAGLVPFGLTFHVGSQCLALENWRSGLRECGKLFSRFPSLKVVNIGGGLPVLYMQAIPSLEQITAIIRDAIAENFDRKPLLYIEPGRFMVADTAIAGTSVIHVSPRNTYTRAVVDLSVFSGLIEILETGDGFTYAMETGETGEEFAYRISGPTCAGTDIIAREVVLPRLNVDYRDCRNNSRLYLTNVGAYTLDYISVGQRTGFNGSRIPDVFFIRAGRIIDA